MKLWLIEQDVNNGYDTFDSAVVAAVDEEAAKDTHPSEYSDGRTTRQVEVDGTRYSIWAPFEKVTATCIGEAEPGTRPGVICASFSAG